MTPYEQKVATVKLEPMKEVGTVELKEIGKGLYGGMLDLVTTPGAYAFDVVLDWSNERTGHVHREERVEQIVRFKSDPAKSEITTTPAVNGVVSVSITPRDRFGNYLGPGYAASIKAMLRGSGKLRSDTPVDPQQIGTYTFEVAAVPKGETPKLDITVDGVPMGK
jgi:hypothetical protein